MDNMKDESPFAQYARLMAGGNAMPGVRPDSSAGYGFTMQPGTYPKPTLPSGLPAFPGEGAAPQAPQPMGGLLGMLRATSDQSHGAAPASQPAVTPGVLPSAQTEPYYTTQPEIYPAPEDLPNISDIWGKAWESSLRQGDASSNIQHPEWSETWPNGDGIGNDALTSLTDWLDARLLRDGRTNWPAIEATPPPDAIRNSQPSYYIKGKRPLDAGVGPGMYTIRNYFGQLFPHWKRLSPEHRQFIADNGANVGFFSDGVRADKPELMRQYRYYDKNMYDPTLIEAGMRQVVENREAVRQAWRNTPHGVGDEAMPWHDINPNKNYVFGSEDCQDYLDQVTNNAEALAKRLNKKLIP